MYITRNSSPLFVYSGSDPLRACPNRDQCASLQFAMPVRAQRRGTAYHPKQRKELCSVAQLRDTTTTTTATTTTATTTTSIKQKNILQKRTPRCFTGQESAKCSVFRLLKRCGRRQNSPSSSSIVSPAKHSCCSYPPFSHATQIQSAHQVSEETEFDTSSAVFATVGEEMPKLP